MYSIIYSVGYMVVVLLSYVSTSDYPFNAPNTVSSPYYFVYDKQNAILSLDVTLKNIPTSVTNVSVIRYTYNYKQGPLMTTANVTVDKNTREGEFTILEIMKYSQTWFDVALHNLTGLCYTSKIIEGRYKFNNYGAYYWDTTQNIVMYYEYNAEYYVINGYCFAPNVCKMEVDLSEVCEDQQVSSNNDLKCKKEKSQYVCTFVQDNMKDKSIVMYQTSEDNTTIEPIHVFKAGGPLHLYFNFELFDNNTFIKLEATSLQKTIKTFKISVTAKEISKANGDVKIQKYSETKNYQFSCEEYINTYYKIYVGVINTTDNKIIKTVMTKTSIELKMEDNGTMLCCMLYDVHESVTRAQEITIKRSVQNKTLLIYQLNESTTTNRPESDELTKLPSSGSNWWIFLIPIGIIIVLIPIIYIFIKRYWHKLRTNSRPTTGTEELNDNANTNQILYAKLDFGSNGGRSDSEQN